LGPDRSDGLADLGIVERPTRTMMKSGRGSASLNAWVPHRGQEERAPPS
jgi:hypothetical protein